MKIIFKCLIILLILNILYYKISIKYIQLDNKIYSYENDTDFSNYKTDIKAIAFYTPFNNNWINIINRKPLYKGNHQPRIPEDNINYLGTYKMEYKNVLKIFKKQVELAKRHGLYGFAIYFHWSSGKILFQEFFNMLINQDFNFPFFFIWKNENLDIKSDNSNQENIIIKQEYKDKDPDLFIKDIKRFLIEPLYIKIDNKPIIGILYPNKIPKLNETIKIWREKSIEYGIGKIYILINMNNNFIQNKKNLYLIDSLFEFCPIEDSDSDFKVKNQNYYLYTYLIYRRNNYKKIKIPIYTCSILEFDKSYNQVNSLNFNEKNRIFFINSWNNWNEGSYLEPDKRYGYASINSLSKAIFNLSSINKFNLNDLYANNKIVVQFHIFYVDLIKEIFSKINNIPVKFSLLISTNSREKKNFIEKYIQNNKCKFFNYEIIILKNKGRDVLPFIIQLKNNFKKYKYVCHIHTKKSLHARMGDEWRNYLLYNLLGNKEIISDILSDFENNDKLGLIFPPIYYKILLFFNCEISKSNLYKMNYLIKQIYPHIKIIDKISEFPAGNMFWARISAIYQIFNINIEKKFPNELGQLDFTIMHAIERIWTYLAKLNGYYYKNIFKHS